jgi:hypothetical protein
MAEGKKIRSPRVYPSPNTSFAASPFANSAVKGTFSPSTPFKAGLSAFPPLRGVDGFDDSWEPAPAPQAGPSSTAALRRIEDFASPFEDDDLESFFDSDPKPL